MVMNASTMLAGSGSVAGSSPGKARARIVVRRTPGVNEIRPDAVFGEFAGPACHQRFERGLGRGIGGPVGRVERRDTGSDEDGAACRRLPQKRIHAPDKAPVGGEIDIQGLLPVFGRDVMGRRQSAKDRRVADKDVESSIALVECTAQTVDALAIGDIEGNENRPQSAGFPYFVIDFLETACRSRDQNKPRSLGAESLRHGRPQTPRGSGHEGDTSVEPSAHFPGRVRACRNGTRADGTRTRLPCRSGEAGNRRSGRRRRTAAWRRCVPPACRPPCRGH